MEAEVGIEHQYVLFSNRHNSQQHKPLRPFLNVFNGLTWVVRHQELFRKRWLLFPIRPQTIMELLFYWSFYWRLYSTKTQIGHPLSGAPWVYKFEVKFHLPSTLCSIVPTGIGMEASIFYKVLPINSHGII